MTNKSGDIGTKTETATVQAIRTRGFPHAERRRLRGRDDAGDITGTPGVCWEVKGGAEAKTASDELIANWMAETALETGHSGADFGVLVVARKGIGYGNAHRWWAILRLWDVAQLATTHELFAPICLPEHLARVTPIRMYLADACRLFVAAGYGEVTS